MIIHSFIIPTYIYTLNTQPTNIIQHNLTTLSTIIVVWIHRIYVTTHIHRVVNYILHNIVYSLSSLMLIFLNHWLHHRLITRAFKRNSASAFSIRTLLELIRQAFLYKQYQTTLLSDCQTYNRTHSWLVVNR